MNCLHCHEPVPSAPLDKNGIPLLPEIVHMECVSTWLDKLEAVEAEWAEIKQREGQDGKQE